MDITYLVEKMNSGEKLSELEVIDLLNKFTTNRLLGITDKTFYNWLLFYLGNFNSAAFREDIMEKAKKALGID